LGARIANPSAVIGILAAVAARARGWSDLVPVDTRPG
ncbi:MAG TPA: ADP-ribose pyrophosphatase, partial [Actinotalea sp.]|nr:ADP-ribose pyrophosphatase [Actinotalea sp.]